MSNSKENLKKQFWERYNQLKASELLLDTSINLLYSINPDVEGRGDCTIGIEEFISKIPEYKAYSEDANAVKQIFEEVNSNKREFTVALAELNYLYDVACFKSQRMLFMHDTFKCFF